jgi:hypothetical protein
MEDGKDALLAFLEAQRASVLAILEELGHLDIVRELLDGKSGLGAR